MAMITHRYYDSVSIEDKEGHMISKKIIGAALLLVMVNVANADSTPEVYPWSNDEVVLATEQWLNIQREGQASSKYIQTVTLAEQEKIMQRWLNSYEHSLPEFFDKSSAGEFTP